MDSNDLDELVGEELSGVTFVRDYLQLQFNPLPVLNAYTQVTVSCGDQVATFGEEPFANLLIGQINKFVRRVELRDDEFLRLTFEDESVVAISLFPADYVGPEAITLFSRDKKITVI